MRTAQTRSPPDETGRDETARAGPETQGHTAGRSLGSDTDLDQDGVLVDGVHIARDLVVVRVELVDVLAQVRLFRVLCPDRSRCRTETVEVSAQWFEVGR